MILFCQDKRRRDLVLRVVARDLAIEAHQEIGRRAEALHLRLAVRQGVEGGCLLLKTLDGETTYNIFANPRPEVGTVITIEGTDFRGVTACMEGIPITVTSSFQ